MQKTLLLNLLRKNPSATFVASLGTISYDLRSLFEETEMSDMATLVSVPGAMGCALAIGLGIALSSSQKVIVVIGDGAILMKLGSVATVLKYRPKNLEVHVMQNNSYASTGNQEINFKYIKNMVPPSFHIHEV